MRNEQATRDEGIEEAPWLCVVLDCVGFGVWCGWEESQERESFCDVKKIVESK